MMNTPTIVNINNFDINRVTFVKNPTKPNRPNMFSVKYDGQNFQLRLPSRMNCRLFARADEKTGEMSYSLTANLKNCDPYAKDRATGSTEVEKLYNALVFDLKEKLLTTATEKSIEWFKRELKREQVEFMFKDMYKLSVTKDENDIYKPNGKYAPSIRIKVPVYDNKVAASVVDYARKDVPVSPETLEQVFENNIEVNMVVVPSAYAASTGFGLTFRLSYAQIFPKQKVTAASIFSDEEPAPQNSNTEEYAEEQPEEEQVTTTPPRPVTPPQLPAAPARKKRSAV